MRIAVVTGASSGIGRETARALAAHGWKVVLVARRRAPLEELAAAITAGGGAAVVEPLDAGDGAAVLTMAERVLAEHGVPELLVHSAGAGQWKYLEDSPPAELAEMWAAPAVAALHVNHAFLRPMLAARRGILVHINSPAALIPWAGATGYAVTRWALRGLHEALRQDLAGTGLHTCHLVFGEVSSAYFDANPGSHEHIPRIARLIPVTSPEAAAAVVLDVVRRPRPEVVYPFVLRTFAWTLAVAPWLVRWLVTLTQRRR